MRDLHKGDSRDKGDKGYKKTGETEREERLGRPECSNVVEIGNKIWR